MLYQWCGKEEALGSSVYVAQSLYITTFEEADGVIKATGRICTMDYVENCDSSHAWKAEGARHQTDEVRWKVQRDPQGRFSWQDKSGRPMFTLSKVFDDAIETFIKAQLGVYMSSLKDEHGAVKTEAVKTYDGPRVKYNGSCVCQQLLRANKTTPFPWETVTEGGQFPQKCFTCSCGRNWWNYNPEEGRWGPVPDSEAYFLLMEYNGEPQKPLGFLKDGFYLIQTLRNQGLVPIG